MEIVVKSRRAEVPERFREHVKGKLERLGKLDAKCYRLDVELSRERNPRLAGSRDRIELTAHSRGPVIRAEAAAADEYAALDLAAGRLEERMRRAADRRAQRHSPHVGRREAAPVSVREAAVVGVPDDLLGEAVRAYVVLEHESQLTERQIVAACRERLESFMEGDDAATDRGS